MRILIINELNCKGGTEIQVHREKEYFQKKGHDVYLLTFDSALSLKMTGTELNYPYKLCFPMKVFHRIYVSRRNIKKIKGVLESVNPDVIHINNIWKVALDIMEAVQNYPTVQTIRDYSVVCPKAICIYDNGTACKGYRNENCYKCIKKSWKWWFNYSFLKKYNNVRRKNVDFFVAPSRTLAKICSQNLLETMCLRDPLDFSKIRNDSKKNLEKKVILYYGMISPIKGVERFLDVLDKYTWEGITVWFIGEIEKDYRSKFLKKIKNKSFIFYLGIKSFEEIMELYKQVYCVVVPSFCIENYPNTALEAVANKTLVIGSNRGGIPEIIGDERFLFDILDLESFGNCMRNAISISDEEYKNATNRNYKRIYKNNTLEKYYEQLLYIYKKAISIKG